MEKEHGDIDLILIESGGDNITTTFSPALADYFIYIIDVSGGDKYPRKRGLGIENCDLLVINKIDLAPYVGADLAVMEGDARVVRGNKPYLLTNCRTGQGVEQVVDHIVRDVLFDSPPKTVAVA
ncbi:MAG: GTP-binding protein, partial [Nitrososphaerales archaeon]